MVGVNGAKSALSRKKMASNLEGRCISPTGAAAIIQAAEMIVERMHKRGQRGGGE